MTVRKYPVSEAVPEQPAGVATFAQVVEFVVGRIKCPDLLVSSLKTLSPVRTSRKATHKT
jgi:hypothetical protein